MSSIEDSSSEPVSVLSHLENAINSHDLGLMASCFDADYQSTFPAHPGRDFRGTEQMKSNWSKIFDGVPNLRAKLLNQAVSGNVVWAEWGWEGNRRDGVPFNWRGVTIQSIRNNRIVSTRLYMEPVVVDDGGVDSAIRREIKTT